MKGTVQIHIASLLIGAIGVVGAVVLLGMSPMQSFIRVTGLVGVEGVPRSDQLVRIDSEETYAVPVGKTLVVTGALGREFDFGSASADVRFDGTVIFRAIVSEAAGAATIAPGLAAAEGVVVTMSGISNREIVLLGYLADAD